MIHNLILISGQYRKLEEVLDQINDLTISKVERPNIYFTYQSDKEIAGAIKELKNIIMQDKRIWATVFEIYGFYNNKIDYLSYLTDDLKNRYDYYKK